MPTRFNMRRPPSLKRAIKRTMPTSLFYRALLILLVPVVVLQLLVAHVFYDRHWDSVLNGVMDVLDTMVFGLEDDERPVVRPPSAPSARARMFVCVFTCMCCAPASPPAVVCCTAMP